MRKRISQCRFFDTETARHFFDFVCHQKGGYDSMSRKDRAALQYFMREFMYLPNTLIARIVGRKPWHVNQTIERMKIAANETRLPVTMNLGYRDFLEYLDDVMREYYDCRNVELSSCTDETERAFLIWEGQKASEVFEEATVDLTQLGLANEMLSMLGLPREGWMADVIVKNFRIEPNDAFNP